MSRLGSSVGGVEGVGGGCGGCLGLRGTVRINKALWLLANEQ